MNRALRLLLALAGLLLLLVLALPSLLGPMAEQRIRHAAAARGWEARWEGLHVSWDGRLELKRLLLTSRAGGDTMFQADSFAVRLDRLALLGLHARVASLGAARAALRLSRPPVADADTLAPSPEPKDTRADPERAARVRRSAEALVRLLFTPTRQLPALTLRDVTIQVPQGAEAFWSGLHLSWLESRPQAGGMRMAAVGTFLGQDELPFAASLEHAADDRIHGGLRVSFPATTPSGPEAVLLTLDGVLHQDPRRGIVIVGDSTRLTLGKIPLWIGATFDRRGPAIHLRLAANDLTQDQVRASLPAAVLGPLLDVDVRGSWDYRLGFDLDLAQPDSVQFDAGVIPHGLQIDPERTRLRVLGLDEPFVATIFLPHGRRTTRELSPANPFYRPLPEISPYLASAVVTNEDGGFFRHRGFNTEAMKAAIAENLKAGAFRRGAGTITMQLARNLYLGHDRTLSRKFREIVLAWILEHLTGVSKERLLEIYLNVIEWGPNVHGAGEAARYYFDREPGDLTVSEALFLTTIIPAPSRWRSRFDASGTLRPFARAQMHFIGRAMVARGWLDAEDLPPTDELDVELRGAARDVFNP
ncbi:MAG: hypothetical protein E6K80_13360 [Candidatus Eisenbacteria bacterium]|uniref:Glycosyl transferase family 51 domain-containing protein n=1 Tax=Eiseniibacteriota bacterium TaxID=2212470 RepID=A0A538TZ45_UNCEI|nr:MAG: hypothetical protein E6K80_13360 [Candidatus Eisenbacteria bacterium]